MSKETQKVVEKKTVSGHRLKVLLRFLVVFILFGALCYSFYLNRPSCKYKEIYVDNQSICSKVVDKDLDRSKGLSGVKNLDEYAAMLFIFEEEGRHGIWMKGMLIQIDILWLDYNKKVIHIEERVSPETYPKAFYPKSNAMYVIETSAGYVDKNDIELLDQFKW